MGRVDLLSGEHKTICLTFVSKETESACRLTRSPRTTTEAKQRKTPSALAEHNTLHEQQLKHSSAQKGGGFRERCTLAEDADSAYKLAKNGILAAKDYWATVP
jgi:hypothetical protein